MNVAQNCLACGSPLSEQQESPFCSHCEAHNPTAAPLALAEGREVGLSPLGLATNLRTVRVQAPAAFALWGPEDIAPHFPQLEILEVIARGGMGVVYKARQAELERLVALKVLLPSASPDPTFGERFLREARALARLNHPHIVTVHEIGRCDELCFLIMEYVDGANLRQLLQAGELELEETLHILIQVCQALQYAHDEQIVHRDVKPDNILVDRRGGAKIVDFGIAKLAGGTPHEVAITNSRQIMGTLFYMAPEQFERPHTVDQRADIYSLGVVLYEAVTGELPLGRFAAPIQKAQIDPRLDRVILQALEKQPEKRYQRVIELQKDLEECLRPPPMHQPVVLQHTTTMLNNALPVENTAEQVVRTPGWALVIAGGLTTLGLIAFVGLLLALGLSEILGGRAGVVAEKIHKHWNWIAGTLAGPLLLVAGRRLERLSARRFVLISAGVGVLNTLIFPSPFNLLNFPIGVWAMGTVMRQDVRSAFQRAAELDRWERRLAVLIVGCVAALVCALAVFL